MAPSTTPSYATASTKRPERLNEFNGVSWFKLQLLFCDAKAIGHTYAYNTCELRRPENSARIPVIFLLDRRNFSPDENRKKLYSLVQCSSPRIGVNEKSRDKKVVEVAVGNPENSDMSECKNASVRTTFSAVIAQLWEMETYGTQVVEPDLFGTGGNELQLILRDA